MRAEVKSQLNTLETNLFVIKLKDEHKVIIMHDALQ